MITVCKAEDEFVNNAHWFADLSNGERIWQDDGRPGVEPASAWTRLRAYVKANGLTINQIYLQFRSHIESPLPANAPAYFFTHAVLGQFGSLDTIRYFVVGWLDHNRSVVHVSKWQVPELVETDKGDRDISKVSEELIIFNS